MVSPIFFYLIGTVFSAALPNVKRHTDASKIFSAGMSEVDNAVSQANQALASLSPQDEQTITSFKNGLTSVVTAQNDITPGIQNALFNDAPLSNAEGKQLDTQFDGLEANMQQLAVGLIGNQDVLQQSGLSCFAQMTSDEIAAGANTVGSVIVHASLDPNDTGHQLDKTLSLFSQLQGLGGSSCN